MRHRLTNFDVGALQNAPVEDRNPVDIRGCYSECRREFSRAARTIAGE